jgi:hypothetical protein
MRAMDIGGITKITLTVVIVVVVAIIAAGGILAFSLMSPASKTTDPSTTTSSSSFTITSSTASSSQSASASNSSWDKYLGYIPSGYTVSPRSPNSPIFPCPSGMTTAQCQQFQQTCGNGVCDPNETCSTCPVDCGVTGAMVCDPYTGRAGAPASVCQVQAANPIAP